MDSSTPLPDTQAPAMEPSSDFKSEWNPKCCGEFERDQIDESEMLSWDLDALSLDPTKPRYRLRHSPIGLALLAYRFKTREPMDVLRECCTNGDSVAPLEGGCPFCPGKPLEHPGTEMSSDEEALEGQE